MLSNKLLSWDYYYHKLPLYLRNSYGFQEHFKILWNLLVDCDLAEDNLLELFDINNPDYESKIMSLYDDPYNYNFNFLDNLGSLFNVQRNLTVQYKDKNDNNIVKKLYLNNHEFLELIKAQIIQNNFNGTYLQIRNFYDNLGWPIYMFNSDDNAEVYVYFNKSDFDNLSSNEKDLFYANIFTIKSMGIVYHTSIREIKAIGVWNVSNWQKGYWS